MTSKHHVIGTVPAHDSARFVSRVDAVHTTHFRTGAPEYWLEVHTYRNFEDARLDRAGWLALRDLCQRVAAEMEGDDGGE